MLTLIYIKAILIMTIITAKATTTNLIINVIKMKEKSKTQREFINILNEIKNKL